MAYLKPFSYGKGKNCHGVSFGNWLDVFFSYQEPVVIRLHCHGRHVMIVSKNPAGVTTARHINQAMREYRGTPDLFLEVNREAFGTVLHSIVGPVDEGRFTELLAMLGDKQSQEKLTRPT